MGVQEAEVKEGMERRDREAADGSARAASWGLQLPTREAGSGPMTL